VSEFDDGIRCAHGVASCDPCLEAHSREVRALREQLRVARGALREWAEAVDCYRSGNNCNFDNECYADCTDFASERLKDAEKAARETLRAHCGYPPEAHAPTSDPIHSESCDAYQKDEGCNCYLSRAAFDAGKGTESQMKEHNYQFGGPKYDFRLGCTECDLEPSGPRESWPAGPCPGSPDAGKGGTEG
jgi:hypothetical protein